MYLKRFIFTFVLNPKFTTEKYNVTFVLYSVRWVIKIIKCWNNLFKSQNLKWENISELNNNLKYILIVLKRRIKAYKNSLKLKKINIINYLRYLSLIIIECKIFRSGE